MLRRLPLSTTILFLTVAQASAVTAQLPTIDVPHGMLRIALDGGFFPTDNVWDNGTRRPLGDLVTAPSLTAGRFPLAASIDADVTGVLGHAGSGTSLGGISTTAERQHGIGSIGLGWALTRRLSIFATVPIVYLRSRAVIRYDSSTANVGINPADPFIGTVSGRSQTTTFFTQLDDAIDTLSVRVAAGAYAGDPTTQALAETTLATAPMIRAALYRMLADTVGAIAVVPTAGSADGTALLAAIDALRSTFTNDLGISGFSGDPALPSDTLDTAQFDNVLSAPTGFGVSALGGRPRWVMGDITAGVTALVLERGTSPTSGTSLWVEASGRFPTASLPDRSVLFGQAAGPPDGAVTVAGIVEWRHGRVGVRADGRYQLQLPYNEQTRLGAPDALLVPAALSGAVRRNPGDVTSLTAWPWIRFAPHLALSATVQYWRKGSDRSAYLAGQTPVGDLPATVLDANSAANSTVLGIGLSYSHNGHTRDGKVGVPVEAGFSIERTMTSSAGFLPAPLTTRMYFRIYKPIVRR
jgi:hypothetical protein